MGETQEVLERLRRALGRPPRPAAFLTRLRLRARPPEWMGASDELREVYRRQALLLSRGRAVWGALVQANMHLFRPGPEDHPAMAVYAPGPDFDDSPGTLGAIAQRLYRLKGTAPADPNQRRLAAMITDERERGLGWTVPPELTGGPEVRSTTFMVFRRHLPGGVLGAGWFPLLVHPATPAVMIVPWRYWPPALVGALSGGPYDGR